jgi:hypothetical protein
MSTSQLLEIVSATGEQVSSDQAEQKHLLALLAEQRRGGPILLYGSSFNLGSVFIHSALVPAEALDGIPSGGEFSKWKESQTRVHVASFGEAVSLLG